MSNSGKDIKIVGGSSVIQIGHGPQVHSGNTTLHVGTLSKVDIRFVVDTTGSMDELIEALLAMLRSFVDEPAKVGIDPAFGLVSFGDIKQPGSTDTIQIVVNMTRDLEEIKQGLRRIPRNNGYGNGGESCLEAVYESLKMRYRKDAVQVLVLITDEPAHQHTYTAEQTIAELKRREFLVFTLATRDRYYQELATQNGGEWSEISANSGLANLKAMLEKMAKRVSVITDDVIKIGGGSVATYLQLTGGTKK